MPHTQRALKVKVERPDGTRLKDLKVSSWPIWTKEPSVFEWSYDEPETCYFLEGEVVVRTPDGEVSIRKGDLVTFPKGLSCTWQVKQAIRKYYRFGSGQPV